MENQFPGAVSVEENAEKILKLASLLKSHEQTRFDWSKKLFGKKREWV